jgi:tryptophan synthase beta chain
MAIAEAIEDAAKNEGSKYSIGSVLNHVVLHQTVMGLEAKKQFELANDYPDVVMGCVGGGSNFAGAVFPFMEDIFMGDRPDLRVVACEPEACPTLSRAPYAYDFGDSAGLTPLLKMYTLGHDFVPPPVHAGGLRYHGDSPLVCKLVKDDYIEPETFYQTEVFEAAIKFARTEGFVVAPEAAHAVRGAIDEALECKETGEERTIFFNCSGHGFFDLSAYDEYLSGELEEFEYPAELAKESLKNVPDVE